MTIIETIRSTIGGKPPTVDQAQDDVRRALEHLAVSEGIYDASPSDSNANDVTVARERLQLAQVRLKKAEQRAIEDAAEAAKAQREADLARLEQLRSELHGFEKGFEPTSKKAAELFAAARLIIDSTAPRLINEHNARYTEAHALAKKLGLPGDNIRAQVSLSTAKQLIGRAIHAHVMKNGGKHDIGGDFDSVGEWLRTVFP